MTSAPMSASACVAHGPAKTRLRSRTLTPVSGRSDILFHSDAAVSFHALTHVLVGKPVSTFPGHALNRKLAKPAAVEDQRVHCRLEFEFFDPEQHQLVVPRRDL